jgi:hypothetical protein
MQTDAVSRQIQELEAIRRQKRLWSWGATVLLALIVIYCVFGLRNAVYGLAQPGPAQEAFQKDLSLRVQNDAIPAITNYGLEGVRGVDYGAAAKKLNDRTPQLVQASMQQMKLLSDDLTKRGNKVFDQTFKAALNNRNKKIREMFPEANEQQVSSLMTNLTSEAQAQVADVNDSLFAPHKQALDSIVTDLTTIQDAEKGHIQGETPSWELGLMVFDIAREDMKGLEIKDDKNSNKNSKTGSAALPKPDGKEQKK